MKRKLLSLVFPVLLALPLGGCHKKDAARYTKDGLFVLHLATPTGPLETQIADAKGFWKEEGIKVDYVGILSPGTEVPAVLSGKVDAVNSLHPNATIKARLAGAKILAVANGMVDDQANPHIVYHVSKRSGIVGIEGLKALAKTRKIRIAVTSRNTCSDWYFDEWLARNGIPEEALDWQIMPAKQQLEALSKGLVDVVTTHPPFIAAADADTNFHRLTSSWEIVGDPAAGASVRAFSEKFIKQYPEQIAAFIRVYVKVHEWSNAHPDSARLIYAKAFKLPPEKVSIFAFNKREWINDSDINPWILRQIAHKDIRPGIKVKASDIYTNAQNPFWKKAGKPNTVFPYQEPKTTENVKKAPGLVERIFGREKTPLRTATR